MYYCYTTLAVKEGDHVAPTYTLSLFMVTTGQTLGGM